MVCIVCGRQDPLHESHVKDESTFQDHEDDRTKNIILLCPIHHPLFDEGKIGICPSSNRLVIRIEDEIYPVKPKSSIQNIKQEYIDWQNRRCDVGIRAALGLIPGQDHASVCQKDWYVEFDLIHY